MEENNYAVVSKKQRNAIIISVFTVLIIVIFIVIIILANKPEEKYLSLGDSAVISNWEISVVDKRIENNSNETKISVLVQAKNTGTLTNYFLGDFPLNSGDVAITLIYSIDNIDYKYNASYGYSNELYGGIVALDTKEDYINFTVPSGVNLNEGSLILKITENKTNYYTVLFWKL